MRQKAQPELNQPNLLRIASVIECHPRDFASRNGEKEKGQSLPQEQRSDEGSRDYAITRWRRPRNECGGSRGEARYSRYRAEADRSIRIERETERHDEQ